MSGDTELKVGQNQYGYYLTQVINGKTHGQQYQYENFTLEEAKEDFKKRFNK